QWVPHDFLLSYSFLTPFLIFLPAPTHQARKALRPEKNSKPREPRCLWPACRGGGRAATPVAGGNDRAAFPWWNRERASASCAQPLRGPNRGKVSPNRPEP